MSPNPLPPDHDIGVAVLHSDGSLTLPNGLRLADQTLTNNRFPSGVFEVLSNGRSSTRINIRFDDGRRHSFVYSGTAWHESSVDSGESGQRQLHRLFTLFTRRRWQVATVAGVLALIVGGAIWLTLRPDTPLHQDVPAGTQSPVAAADSPAALADTVAVPPTAHATISKAAEQLSDEDILQSSELTFEQKRSRLYDLADTAGKTIAELQSGTNFFRTCERLSRYRVRFSNEAERGFGELVDRVHGYSESRVRIWQTLSERASGIARMKPHIYERLKEGGLDPKARQLYIIISDSAESVCSVRRDLPNTEELRSRIIRWSVSGRDLFEELAAIRYCQRCLEHAFQLDDEIAEFLSLVPDEVLVVGGFRREPALEARLQEARNNVEAAQKALSEALGEPKAQSGLRRVIATGSLEEARFRLGELERSLGTVMALSVTIPQSERETLRRTMAMDAGVLENALNDYLLDYPWPWTVDTIKPTGRLFELTTRPAR